MAKKAEATLKLREDVRNWAMTDGKDIPFDMPSGAGTMSGMDIVRTMDKGGPSPDGDYTSEELVRVLTEYYDAMHPLAPG